ncbi:MAG: imidazole glycerol phosphate synthase subunit HisH [Spirochaetales bacterium]
MVKIGIMDYKAGNIRSVLRAIQYLGAEGRISSDPEVLKACDKLIIPGDGEAFAVMEVLKTTGLETFLREFYASGKPLLGICIGCQIVLDFSEERSTPCLGFIPGKVVRFPRISGLKVPHMGWNQVTHGNAHPIFYKVPEHAPCYFVHSYYPLPQEKVNTIAWTEYGITFPSAIQKDNLIALQFHPEKSADSGLQMLANFIYAI